MTSLGVEFQSFSDRCTESLPTEVQEGVVFKDESDLRELRFGVN